MRQRLFDRLPVLQLDQVCSAADSSQRLLAAFCDLRVSCCRVLEPDQIVRLCFVLSGRSPPRSNGIAEALEANRSNATRPALSAANKPIATMYFFIAKSSVVTVPVDSMSPGSRGIVHSKTAISLDPVGSIAFSCENREGQYPPRWHGRHAQGLAPPRQSRTSRSTITGAVSVGTRPNDAASPPATAKRASTPRPAAVVAAFVGKASFSCLNPLPSAPQSSKAHPYRDLDRCKSCWSEGPPG